MVHLFSIRADRAAIMNLLLYRYGWFEVRWERANGITRRTSNPYDISWDRINSSCYNRLYYPVAVSHCGFAS